MRGRIGGSSNPLPSLPSSSSSYGGRDSGNSSLIRPTNPLPVRPRSSLPLPTSSSRPLHEKGGEKDKTKEAGRGGGWNGQQPSPLTNIFALPVGRVEWRVYEAKEGEGIRGKKRRKRGGEDEMDVDGSEDISRKRKREGEQVEGGEKGMKEEGLSQKESENLLKKGLLFSLRNGCVACLSSSSPTFLFSAPSSPPSPFPSPSPPPLRLWVFSFASFQFPDENKMASLPLSLLGSGEWDWTTPFSSALWNLSSPSSSPSAPSSSSSPSSSSPSPPSSPSPQESSFLASLYQAIHNRTEFHFSQHSIFKISDIYVCSTSSLFSSPFPSPSSSSSSPPSSTHHQPSSRSSSSSPLPFSPSSTNSSPKLPSKRTGSGGRGGVAIPEGAVGVVVKVFKVGCVICVCCCVVKTPLVPFSEVSMSLFERSFQVFFSFF